VYQRWSPILLCLGLVLAGCTGSGSDNASPSITQAPSDSDSSQPAVAATGNGAPSGLATPSTGASSRASSGSSGPVPAIVDQVRVQVAAYRKAHTGNGGKEWDINAKTPGQIANDPAAQQLLALCGPDQRPVIPWLAWEYGGNDHQWIHPEKSALVYCVYTPVKKKTADWSDHWKYNAAKNKVTADVYVRFPEQNPCRDKSGMEQIDSCIGDYSNYEILVDTISLHDGHDVNLELADSSTALWLVLPDQTKELLANFD
jgi:hypothetical protein